MTAVGFPVSTTFMESTSATYIKCTAIIFAEKNNLVRRCCYA